MSSPVELSLGIEKVFRAETNKLKPTVKDASNHPRRPIQNPLPSFRYRPSPWPCYESERLCTNQFHTCPRHTSSASPKTASRRTRCCMHSSRLLPASCRWIQVEKVATLVKLTQTMYGSIEHCPHWLHLDPLTRTKNRMGRDERDFR
jgi:hypothetical protein